MASTSRTVVQGTTDDLSGQYLDANGAAIDITGYTFYFMVKKKLTDADTSATISKTMTLSSPATGEWTGTATATDTDVASGQYWYQYKWTTPAGKTYATVPAKYIVQATVRQD
jgi:hypothetical protein